MNSFLGYLGGKRLLVKQILPLIPSHKTYVEVFAGAAWLLFAKEPSKIEIINDINTELITLYKVVKDNFDEFCEEFKWQLIARDEFRRLKRLDPSMLTDVERAIRIFYLIKNSYGCKVANNNFISSRTQNPRYDPIKIEENLKDVHHRLSKVWIENLPYDKIIRKSDNEQTFFYIDPPYFDGENNYGKGIFDKSDWIKLKELLTKVNGKFILSINDVPEIRKIFKDFNRREVSLNYSLQRGRGNKVQELLFMNY